MQQLWNATSVVIQDTELTNALKGMFILKQEPQRTMLESSQDETQKEYNDEQVQGEQHWSRGENQDGQYGNPGTTNNVSTVIHADEYMN